MSEARLTSMTGFGAGRASLGGGFVSVELRAVNHRHLDVRVRLPNELADASGVVEDVVRARCVRGRIEAEARWDVPASAGVSFDMERARAVYGALRALRDELAPGEPVPVEAVLRVPGVLLANAAGSLELAQSALRAAADQAARDLATMRAREGAALAADLKSRLSLVSAHAAWVEAHRPAVVEGHRQRFRKRIEKLLEGSGVELDPARLVQEVALFADKSDVAEELTRLSSHLAQFARTLDAPSESVGKKLEFLVQEIGREVNTIGSKANDAAVAQRVVDMKAELERIREQVLNVL